MREIVSSKVMNPLYEIQHAILQNHTHLLILGKKAN